MSLILPSTNGKPVEIRPSKIIALGLNYLEHIKESQSVNVQNFTNEIPTEPVLLDVLLSGTDYSAGMTCSLTPPVFGFLETWLLIFIGTGLKGGSGRSPNGHNFSAWLPRFKSVDHSPTWVRAWLPVAGSAP